jgi:WD40 repeat protein/uncharacterized caspase-like protein
MMRGHSNLLLNPVWIFLALPVFAEVANAQGKPNIEVVASVGHSDKVNSVAFSPDGMRILSGSSDHTVKLWDVTTGAVLRTFEGHSDEVTSVALSPDGARVLSGGTSRGSHLDDTVKLWDATTGVLLRTFEGHSGGVRSVAFSPDGARVLSAGLGDVKLWDAATGALLHTFQARLPKQSIPLFVLVAFSPDGRRVLSGGNDLKLWDATTGGLLRTFEGSGSVSSVGFSPDGVHVLSGGDVSDNTVKLWSASTGKLLRVFQPAASRSGFSVNSVAFSPDGRRVVSGGHDLKIWDAATGALLRTFEHSGLVSWVAFSPDGTRVLSGINGYAGNSTIRLWDAASGELLRVFDAHSEAVNSVAFSPDGAHVLSGSGSPFRDRADDTLDRAVTLWDATTGAVLRTFDGHRSPLEQVVTSVAFSPDGSLVISGGYDWEVKLQDAATGALLRTFAGHSASVDSVAFSPDGTRLLSGSLDKTSKLWDTATGALLHTFEGQSYGVGSVAFSRDGRRVLSAGPADEKFKLWDAATGDLLRTFEGHSLGVSSVVFSPEGTHIISASRDETVKLWDAATGALLRTFDDRPTSLISTNFVNSLAFSPDGTRVISGTDHGMIKLWDAATGKLLFPFEGRSGAVTSLAFSPDGRHLVSASKDGTIKHWNPEVGRLVATSIRTGNGEWLAMTPEGFFAGSVKGADEVVQVVRGFDAYSIEQMYQALFNPDLVRERLAGDPDEEVKKAATVLDLAKVVESGQAPRVALVSPARGSTSKDEVIAVEARITDAGGGIGRIEWRVNGITVGVSNAPSVGKERAITQTLALESGENTIEVVAYNGRNLPASLPVSTTVTWNAPANQAKPKLFVIAVGINQYSDALFRPLSFAVADANAFGAAIKAAGEGLYGEGQVDVTYVLDADATAGHLERVIDEVGAKMNPRDVFIFLAAAHGKSENGRFHLIPQDYRSVGGRFVTEGTIGQEQLQDWFANRIKARRGLILLDTCQSGALVASRASGVDAGNSEAALGRLNEATRRPVLTAAAADQAALEGYRGHGVFTYALLDALVNGDTNHDGKIELSELVAHIQTLAPKLSREMRGGRGPAVAQKSRAAEQLGDAPIASRYADYRQKPRLGSRGENFPLVNRLSALPTAAAQ